MGQFDLKIRNQVRPTLLTFDNIPLDGTTVTNKDYIDSTVSSAVAAKSITLTGDVTGSGTSSFATTLSATGVSAGTYAAVTVDLKGRITAGQGLTLSGDVIGISSGNTLTASLSSTGVAAGTYTKVTVDIKGRVTSATSLGSSDVTTALGFTPVSTAGSTMTGPLILSGSPTNESQAVTKDYVDRKAFFALAVGIY
jgi:trimeric autotransporter adhesin